MHIGSTCVFILSSMFEVKTLRVFGFVFLDKTLTIFKLTRVQFLDQFLRFRADLNLGTDQGTFFKGLLNIARQEKMVKHVLLKVCATWALLVYLLVYLQKDSKIRNGISECFRECWSWPEEEGISKVVWDFSILSLPTWHTMSEIFWQRFVLF